MTRLVVLSMILLTGGCLGIEGTDVSTGAAPSSEGDEGYETVSSTAGDPTGAATTDPSTTDPSGTGDDGPLTASDTADTDTRGDTTDDGESTGVPPTDSSSGADGAEGPTESGTSGTGDIDTDGTDGTDTSSGSDSSESGSESTGDECGDGEVQIAEQCDGDDLQGFDCVSLGFEGGQLACDPVLCIFDDSACSK